MSQKQRIVSLKDALVSAAGGADVLATALAEVLVGYDDSDQMPERALARVRDLAAQRQAHGLCQVGEAWLALWLR